MPSARNSLAFPWNVFCRIPADHAFIPSLGDGRCRRFLLAAPLGAQRIKVTTQTGPALRDGHGRARSASSRISTKDDFEVYDNGKLQTHHHLRQQATPITVVVMLDTSGSMTLALDL